MQLKTKLKYAAFEEVLEGEIIEASEAKSDDLKQLLETSAKEVIELCSHRLKVEGHDMTIRDLKDLANIMTAMYKAHYNDDSITINNIQNISATKLEFFKGNLIDEI